MKKILADILSKDERVRHYEAQVAYWQAELDQLYKALEGIGYEVWQTSDGKNYEFKVKATDRWSKKFETLRECLEAIDKHMA